MKSEPEVTFESLRSSWPWRPIRHCPGRFILPLCEGRLSFEELVGRPCSPDSHQSPAAPDQILVLPLKDGGLITYLKPDGQLLHTLSTSEGFMRKLTQLGIRAYEEPSNNHQGCLRI